MKTIAIDASRANVPNKTGVEWYAHNIIQELKRVVPPDYRVVLYSRESLTGELAELPALWKSRVLGWPPRVMWSQFRLAWELLWHPPELFFEPSHVVPFLFPQGRTVATLHDVAFVRFPKAYTPWGWFYHIVTTFYSVLRRVRFVAVSEFSKREMIGLFRARPEQISVVPLAPSIAVEPAEWESVRAKYGITAPFFLFVGRLETKKNIGRLLAAFGEYCERTGSERQLVLVGKRGEGYNREVAPYREKPWFRQVKELGYVGDAETAALFSHATAFVFPSLYEGFGIPVLEAMRYGCPVITSSITALPEVVGDAAMIVDATNVRAIATAMVKIEDKKLQTHYKEKGLRRVAQFSWRSTAQETWQVLQQVLEKKKK